jgi:hypothetical protein
MRKLLLVACAAIASASCGEDAKTEQTSNNGEQITAESIGGNDVTAIDAATSSDANMAADVEFNIEDLNALEADGNVDAAMGNED